MKILDDLKMKLNQFMRSLLVIGISALSTGCLSTSNELVPTVATNTSATNTSEELVIATWNVEHLAYPVSAGCKPRTEQELTELKKYAQSLNADIVALQEVASIKAVEQLFPSQQWQIYLSERADTESYACRGSDSTSTQQKVAFAVRKELMVNNVNSIDAFSVGNGGLRHGLELDVSSSFGRMSLLNVHMKSGCFVDDFLRSDSKSCRVFAKQAPILDSWVESKEKQQVPYVVLGDFNHRLSAPYNRLTRALTTNSDGSASSIVNTTEKLIGCHPYYPAPIDHIWAGNVSLDVDKKVSAVLFNDMNPKAMLSDHCAVSLTLNKTQGQLSSAVQWHTRSKEYALLTESIYQQATKTITKRPLSESPWVVVMDIDETVLDNSAYQVMIERKGQQYHPRTWAQWVKTQNATLVPGSAEFIRQVLKKGGKLALITNRDRALDEHTWQNLQLLGLPITVNNTCLLGRNQDDKDAIDHALISNDKDLRRQQLTAGTASCYYSGDERKVSFPKLNIVMQVGDNIEDFAGETQEAANVKELLSHSKTELILLPNSMYGSW